MNKEERADYARNDKDINMTLHRMSVIEARITKEVWTDPIFDKEKLRKAEVTLRLDADEEYNSLQQKYWDLEEKRQQLNYLDFDALEDELDDMEPIASQRLS